MKIRTPFISVIIPVWNRPGSLQLSVSSVLAQTYSNWELLIVDDGSTDDTAKVARTFCDKDSRVKLIQKEHSGVAETLNLGLQEMKGSIFCFLGSDDLWLPNKLEEQIIVHAQFPTHVLHTESYRILVDGTPCTDIASSALLNELAGTTPDKFFVRHYNAPYAAFFGSSLYIPKAIFDTVGGFQDVIGEDYAWVLNALFRYNVKFTLVPQFLMKKRVNPASISTEKRELVLKEAKQVWEDMRQQSKVGCYEV